MRSSRSPRGRSPDASPRSATPRSPQTRPRGSYSSPSRSPSVRSRSRSASRGRSRTPEPRRRNGYRGRSSPSRSVSRNRAISRSRSRSRGGRRYRSRSYSRSPSRSPPPRRSSKVVVEKLTKNVNEQHLREIFGTYGEIQSLELPMNPQFMTNRGTAYILYYEPEAAEAAISHMHEGQLDGAVLNVSIVLPRRTFSRSPPPARTRPGFGRLDRGPYGRSALDGGRPPRRGSPGRHGAGRGMERHDLYRPRSRSRSPRGRSPVYSSRSPSRSPPPRRGSYRRSSSPRHRRRGSSYDSYSDRRDSRSRTRTRSPSRNRYGGRR